MMPKRWKRTRKVVQYIALLAFIVLFVWSRRGGWPAELVNIPMRLDPLGMLAHLIASRTLLAGSALALVTVMLTLVLGRAWCGWLCPLGTVLDLFTLRRLRHELQPKQPLPPELLRNLKYGLLFTILIAALFTNLTLLIFDPLTIVFRTLATSIWPAADRVITALETTLYEIPALGDPLAAFDALVRPTILPEQPVFYRDAALFLGIFVSLVALNVIAPRFWCRYLCPLGSLLGLLSKVGIVRREVITAQCTGCDACARVPDRHDPVRRVRRQRSQRVHHVPGLPGGLPARRHNLHAQANACQVAALQSQSAPVAGLGRSRSRRSKCLGQRGGGAAR